MTTSFADLRRATLSARARTSDAHIGVQVYGGIFDVVRAIPPATGKCRYTIDYLKAGLSLPQAVAYLDTLQ